MENIKISTARTLDKQDIIKAYDQYSPEIFRYASRMLNDSYQAEECVSETFSRFLRSARDGKIPQNMRAYLFRTAHNWIIDRYRSQPLTEVSLEDDHRSDPEENPAQLVAVSMDRQRVQTALLKLSPEQRQVVELRFVEGWSHEDVADAIGKSIEATRALQHRAVSALRALLTESE